MKKHWFFTFILMGVFLYFLREKTIESQIYSTLTTDCSVYKGRDHKEFMDCWRSRRKAGYALRKRLGDYDRPTEQKVVAGN